MNPIATHAEEALRGHTHPALLLTELVELIAPRVDRSLDAGRVRAVLEEHPERFRVIEPWRGRWRSAAPRDGVARVRAAWVVAIGHPDGPHDAPPAAARLRESVRWLSRGVDPRSQADVSRWHAIVLAERAARRLVLKRAA